MYPHKKEEKSNKGECALLHGMSLRIEIKKIFQKAQSQLFPRPPRICTMDSIPMTS